MLRSRDVDIQSTDQKGRVTALSATVVWVIFHMRSGQYRLTEYRIPLGVHQTPYGCNHKKYCVGS